MRARSAVHYQAIILAGNAADSLAYHFGVASKGLVPWDDDYLVSNVLRIVPQHPEVDSVGYVGAAPAGASVHWRVPAGKQLSQSIQHALTASYRHSKGDPYLLLMSADVPYLELANLDRVLQLSSMLIRDNPYVDGLYLAVYQALCLRDYPQYQRTSIHLREGKVVSGNLLIIRRSSLYALMPWVDAVYAQRKQPLGLAALLGAPLLARLLTRQLSVAWLEAYFQHKLNLKVKLVLSRDATLATDIDSLADWQVHHRMGARR